MKLQDTKSIYRTQLFFYMQTKQISEKDTKNIVLFATTSKTVKYFGINLTKGVKFLCNENYISLMKEMENDTKKWKNILCSQIGRISVAELE